MADMTPEQWRDHLIKKLGDRQGKLERFQCYYDGDHPLPVAPKRLTEKFRELQRQSRTNWMELVVDAVAERLQVVGFRFGGEKEGDAEAWRIWQANKLDADSKLVHVDALSLGSSFALVWPDEASPVKVRITAEHPTQCIVAYEPGERRKRAAGLKLWTEDDGTQYATVYLPGLVYRYVSPTTTSTIMFAGVQFTGGDGKWMPRVTPGEAWPIELDVDDVVLAELRPRPRWDGCGRSELEGLTDIQDRINTTTLGRLAAGEFSAFRQRWATGMDIPEDDEGNPIEPFESAVDRLWVSESNETTFGEFSQTDLTNYVKSVEADVTHLAAISKTPPHYLLGALVNASGDALKSAETGLVSKARDRQAFLGEDWEDIMRLAFAVAGDDERAADFAAEVLWSDPETRSDAELVDALTKMVAIGMPRQVAWERFGASPQEIERWKMMATEDALLTALAVPSPPPPSSTAPPAPPAPPAQPEPAPTPAPSGG